MLFLVLSRRGCHGNSLFCANLVAVKYPVIQLKSHLFQCMLVCQFKRGS